MSYMYKLRYLQNKNDVTIDIWREKKKHLICVTLGNTSLSRLLRIDWLKQKWSQSINPQSKNLFALWDWLTVVYLNLRSNNGSSSTIIDSEYSLDISPSSKTHKDVVLAIVQNEESTSFDCCWIFDVPIFQGWTDCFADPDGLQETGVHLYYRVEQVRIKFSKYWKDSSEVV